MIRRLFVRSLAVTAALAALAAVAAAQRLTVSGPDVGIWNLAGATTVEAGPGPDVVVEVRARGQDADRLSITRGPIRGRSTLRVIYPGRRVVYEAMPGRGRSSARVRSDGTFSDGSDLLARTVDVASSGGGLHAWADLRVLVPAGQKVAIYTVVGPFTATNVDGTVRLDGGSSTVSATGGRGALTVDVGSGTVAVERHRGDVLVDTGAGNVRLDDVRGGSVSVDTGSGSLTARSVSADLLHVDTGSGSVTVDDADAAKVTVDTGSGAVSLGLLHPAPDVLVDTGAGAVRLTVPANFSAALHLETSSGGIDCDLPFTSTRVERDVVMGRVGDGRGRVHVDTGSGSVRISRATAH